MTDDPTMALEAVSLSREEASLVLDTLMREVARMTSVRDPAEASRCRELSTLARRLYAKGVRPTPL